MKYGLSYAMQQNVTHSLKRWVFCLGVLFLQGILWAQEKEVFLSLTRTALSKEDLPTNTTVITQEDIQRVQARTLGEALQKTTPLQIQELGSTPLNVNLAQLRGFFSKGVAVFIDDRRIPSDVTGSTDLSKIPVDNIDRIEIVRGAGSVLYGADAQGGVINIRTKRLRATTPSSTIQTEYRSYNTSVYSGHYGVKVGRFDTFLSASETRTDGFQTHSEARLTSASTHFGYDFGRVGRTSLDAQYSDAFEELSNGTDIPIGQWDGEVERTSNSTLNGFNDFTNTGIYTFSLQHEWEAENRTRLTGRIAGTKNRIDGENFGPTDNRSRDKSGYLQMDLPFGFTSAYEYEQQRIDSLSIGSDHTNTWAVLFQQQLKMKNLFFIPAVRYDKNTSYGDTTNPRLAVICQAAPWLKFSSNAGSSFHAPTFADRLGFPPFALPAPDLKPEKTWQYDLGFEIAPQQTRQSFRLATTAFHTITKNRITNVTVAPFVTQAQNINNAFSQGVEVELAHTIGPKINHGVNYTYLQNKGQQAGSSRNVPLQFSPRHKTNYYLSLTMPFELIVLNTLQYVDKQYTSNNLGGLKLPSYFLWNIRLTQKILDGELFFGVDNILDKHYATNGFNPTTFPQPGRTFRAGLSIKFWD